MVRFATVSKIPPEKIAFVIADARSNLGRATRQSGIVTNNKRASFVIPITVNDIPKFCHVIGGPDIVTLQREDDAVLVLVIDAEDRAAMVWERLLPPPQGNQPQNRSIIVLHARDRG
jgi:hypothetical protein